MGGSVAVLTTFVCWQKRRIFCRLVLSLSGRRAWKGLAPHVMGVEGNSNSKANRHTQIMGPGNFSPHIASIILFWICLHTFRLTMYSITPISITTRRFPYYYSRRRSPTMSPPPLVINHNVQQTKKVADGYNRAALYIAT